MCLAGDDENPRAMTIHRCLVVVVVGAAAAGVVVAFRNNKSHLAAVVVVGCRIEWLELEVEQQQRIPILCGTFCVILRDIGFLQHTFWMADDDDSVGGGREEWAASKPAVQCVLFV